MVPQKCLYALRTFVDCKSYSLDVLLVKFKFICIMLMIVWNINYGTSMCLLICFRHFLCSLMENEYLIIELLGTPRLGIRYLIEIK